MKCPKCRKEIAIEAMECRCGWSARVEVVPEVKRISKEEAAVHIETMKKMLGKATKRLAPEVSDREPVTEGHEGLCVCEICWGKRMKLRDLRAQFPTGG